MLNITQFGLFAIQLLENHNVEVNTVDGKTVFKADMKGDADALTQEIFKHDRLSVSVAYKDSSWVLGGMELVKEVDADSGEVFVYIENHNKQMRGIAQMATDLETSEGAGA